MGNPSLPQTYELVLMVEKGLRRVLKLEEMTTARAGKRSKEETKAQVRKLDERHCPTLRSKSARARIIYPRMPAGDRVSERRIRALLETRK
jgi:hypothetical protein